MSLTVDFDASTAAAEQASDQVDQPSAASEAHAAGVATLWIVFYTVIAAASLVHHFAA